MPKRIMIVAGGTGGHIFPGMAIAEKCSAAGASVSWMGTGGLECEIVRKRHWPLYVVPFKRAQYWVLPWAICKAVVAIWRVQPDVVLGMGGYASVPGGIAARLCGKKLVLHEQNAVMGKANRLLYFLTKHVLTGFPDSTKQARWTGNPVQQKFLNLKAKKNVGTPQNILVLGGSQGARTLNQVIPKALTELSVKGINYCVVHQCGRGNKESVLLAYQNYQAEKIEVLEFITDVEAKMQFADIVICRAGAATLSELAVTHSAAILVPYPHAAADHQFKNAEIYQKRGAAILCRNDCFTVEWLNDCLQQLKESQLNTMRTAIGKLAMPQAAQVVADFCLQEVLQ